MISIGHHTTGLGLYYGGSIGVKAEDKEEVLN